MAVGTSAASRRRDPRRPDRAIRAATVSVALAAVMLAAGVLAAPPARLAAQTQEEARRGYDANIRATERAALACDARAYGPLVTPDTRYVDHEGRVAEGRAAVVALIRGDCAAIRVTGWTYETTRFASSGGVAYGSGISRATAVDRKSGQEYRQAVHFLIVMRRQPDGTWARAEELWAPTKADAKPGA